MPLRLIQKAEHRIGPHFAQLARGLGSYGTAEFATRIVRLLTTVVIARSLAPAIVGEAALALTVFELVRVLERIGTGQQIVQAKADELAATCNSVQRFYAGWTGALMVVQLLVAAMLELVFDRPTAAAMLAVLTLVYPFMAGGHVPYYLAMREGQVTRLARIGASQSIADQIITAALLLIWPSPWSIVLPKLLTAPIWLIMARRAAPWQPDRTAGQLPASRMLRYAGPIMLADGMTALRTQGDNLIVAAVLGTSALGTYYFAFNAGVGIVSSLVTAFGSVAFPMLCAATVGAARRRMLRRIALGGAVVILPIVALQALAAPLYVPLVFGSHWAFAAPLVAILCLAGVPLLVAQIAGCWLRAEGRVGTDAAGSTLTCVLALGGLWLGAQFGDLIIAAIGLIAGQIVGALWNGARILLPALDLRSFHALRSESRS
ncbi:oligosaccharide flippase family protein [Novosphingobium sp. MMS21-SN21R]|uniref:oligosaccharide flippase family protein n=1 Tax=Novosphingobium sp. MMS21-SN21R TaxID=2969298 RepID=UPI00288837EC|nr:oligosaccharide flippase family protein [Novosphingobium sp. MMS21-SN21R]MDT0506954.1 oligosaccharide flippase family protein [Novosphingobium sp. MMS21-SN21R]